MKSGKPLMTTFSLKSHAKPHYIASLLYPLAASSFIIGAASVYAAPTGGEVTSGEASIKQSGNVTQITQSSNTASLDWQTFNVNAAESVNFIQPSAAAVAINRIYDQNASQILGTINANGRLFLQNPNGFIFGKNAVIDVNSIIATTLNINDQGNGRYVLAADKHNNGQIINRGLIHAATGGSVSLVANSVDNQGTIIADYGHINLASGRQATIDFDGDGLIRFAVDAETINNDQQVKDAIKNSGSLQANGGTIALTAKTAQGVFDQAINNEGLIEAGRIANIGGEIHLVGIGAPVIHSGEILATGNNGNGGLVHIESDNMTITTGNSVTDVSAESGIGGFVKFLGKLVGLLDDSSVDAAGETGGGKILVGGTFQGKDAVIQNAEKTIVAANVNIKANANTTGNGGEVIIWSDIFTQYYGSIEAMGGSQSGNGGFVEVSGKQTLTTMGAIDTSAAMGESGTILFDPLNIKIVATASTSGYDVSDNKVSFADAEATNSELLASNLETLSGKIILQATNDITVDSAVALGNAATEFNLQAGNNINVNAAITTNNTAGTDIHLEADSPHSTSNAADGAGSIIFGAGGSINSNGGNITFIAADFDLANAIKIDAGGTNNGNINIALSQHNNESAKLSISESDDSSQLMQSELVKFQNVNTFTIGTATTKGGNGDGTGNGPKAPNDLQTHTVNIKGSIDLSTVADTLDFTTNVTLGNATTIKVNNIKFNGTTLDAANNALSINATGEIDIKSNVGNLDDLSILQGTATANTVTKINAVDTLSLGGTGNVTLLGALDRSDQTATNLANTLTVRNAANNADADATFGNTILTGDVRIDASKITFDDSDSKIFDASSFALTLDASSGAADNVSINASAVSNLSNLNFAQGNADANTRALLNNVATLTLGESDNTIILGGELNRTGTTSTTLNGHLNLASNTLTSGGNFDTNGKNIIAGELTVADGTFNSESTAGTWDVNGNVSVSSGAILNATAGNFSVAGDWTNSGIFNHNSSSIDFDGITEQTITSGGSAFNSASASNNVALQDTTSINTILTIDSGKTFSLSGQNFTLGTLTNSGTLQLQGNETLAITTMDTDSGTVKYIGTGGNNTFTIQDFGAADYNNLIIDGASNETFQLAADLKATNTLSIANNDTLSLAGNGLDIVTLDNAGTLQLQGNEALTITNMDTDSGTVKYIGTGGNNTFTIQDFGATDYNNLIIDGTSNETFQLAADLKATDTLSIANNDTLSLAGNGLDIVTLDNASTLQLQGNEALTITNMDTDSGTVKYTGTGGNSTFIIKDFGATDYFNLEIASASGNDAFILDDALVIGNGLTITTGTLDTKASESNSINIAGNWTNNGGSFIANNGTVTFDGTTGTQNITSSNGNFYNLTASGASTINLLDGLTVDNILLNSAGNFNGNAVTISSKDFSLAGGTFNNTSATMFVSGNWLNTGGVFTHNNSTVNFNGTSDTQDITSNSNNFYNLTTSGASAIRLFDDLIVNNVLSNNTGNFDTNGKNITAGGLTITGGLFNSTPAAGAWDINGDVSIANGAILNATSGAFTVSGNWINSGTFNANNGTLNFDGTTGTQNITSNNGNFYNLTASGASTINLLDGLTVDNILLNSAGNFNGNAVAISSKEFSLSGGTFNNTSATMLVSGNWTNNGGTFNANNGAVIFSGASNQTVTETGVFNTISIAKSAGDISFANTLISESLAASSGNYSIALKGVANKIDGNTIFLNSGTVTLGETTFANGVQHLSGNTIINGGLSSNTGNFIFKSLSGSNIALTGNVLLNQDLNLSSNGNISINGNLLANSTSSLVIDGSTNTTFTITGDIGKNIDGEKISSVLISDDGSIAGANILLANINNIYADNTINIAANTINIDNISTDIFAKNAMTLSDIQTNTLGAALNLQSNNIIHKNISGISKLKIDTPTYTPTSSSTITVEELTFANSSGNIFLQEATSGNSNDLNIGNTQLKVFDVTSKYIFESTNGDVFFTYNDPLNASTFANKVIEINNGGILSFAGAENKFFRLTANSNNINILDAAKVTTTESIFLNAKEVLTIAGILETKGADSTLSLTGNSIAFGSAGNLASAVTAAGNLVLATTSGFNLNGDTTISAASDIDLSGTDINRGIAQAALTVQSTGGNIILGNIGKTTAPVLSLTINASNGILTLKGDINTTGEVNFSAVTNIVADGSITIRADGGLDVATVGINGNQDNSGSLAIYSTTGPINLNSIGTTEALAFLSIGSDKLLTITGNITVTNTLDLSGTKIINFVGDSIITANNATAKVNLAVGTSVNGDAGLTINNSGETFLGGTMNFVKDLNFSNAGTLNISKNLTMRSNGILSFAGNIISSGTTSSIDMSGLSSITLANDTDFNTSASNASLNLSSTGIQGPGALSINTGSGNLTLSTIGDTATLRSLTVASSGLSTLEGNITTGKTGINFSNASNILLGNDITLATRDNGIITMDGGAVNGTFSLTLNTPGNGTVTINSMGQETNNALSSLTVINSGETFFNNANIMAVGENSINLSQAPQVYMIGDVVFESTANTGIVKLNGGKIDGDGSLTVIANEGMVELGTVGSKVPLAFLNIQSNGGSKAFGNITTLNNIDLALATMSSGITTPLFDWSLTSTNGDILLGDLTNGTLFGSITATSGNKIVLNGNISTQGTGISLKSPTPDRLTANVVLASDVTINTSLGNGIIDLSNTLLFGKDESATGDTFGLTLTSGEANILLNSSDQNSALTYLNVTTLADALTTGKLYVDQNIDYTSGSFNQDSLSSITSNFANIVVTANTGNVALGLLSAPNGTVTVNSVTGSILSNTSTPFIDTTTGVRSKGTEETINIAAQNTVLNSAGSFGASTIDPIIVAVDPNGKIDINFSAARGYIDNLNGTAINNLSSNSLIDQLQIRSAISDTIAVTNKKLDLGVIAQSEFVLGETLFGILGTGFYVAHASGTGSITARSLVPDVPALLQDTTGWKFERPSKKKRRTIHKSRNKNETLINWF